MIKAVFSPITPQRIAAKPSQSARGDQFLIVQGWFSGYILRVSGGFWGVFFDIKEYKFRTFYIAKILKNIQFFAKITLKLSISPL